MTRESKLALIIGFVLVLVVGVLVSDHFSQANNMLIDKQDQQQAGIVAPITDLGQQEKQGLNDAIDNAVGDRRFAQSNPNRNSGLSDPRGESYANNTNSEYSLLDDAFDGVKNRINQTNFPPAEISNSSRTRRQQSDSIPNPGSSTTRTLAPVTHKFHTVVSGDSLIKIARRTLNDGERWKQIHELNADILGPDAILQIGMRLKLPNDARSLERASSSNQQPKKNSSQSVSSYKVVAGDTLGEISMQLLGTSKRAKEIAELNGLESVNDIRIGMTLKIPAK